MKKKDAVLALLMVPGIGPVRFSRLVRAFGSADGVWGASHAGLSSVVPPSVASRIVQGPDPDAVRRLRERVEGAGAWIMFRHDRDYPTDLSRIPDPPAVLFGRGNRAVLSGPCVAVVGSRKASSYGVRAARMVFSTLVEHGVTVVSGLAMGIDTVAHRRAVEEGGLTVAVKGCGIDVGYPARNVELAGQIAEKGAVISEFDPYDQMYKYVTKETFASYKEAYYFKKMMRVKGAFIVAYRNGKRIRNISEVVDPSLPEKLANEN
jgi:DNA processing protein